MANTLQYLESNKIHIFPCANRGSNIDLEAKLNTEYNLINLPSLLSTATRYTIGWKDATHIIRFILNGYYVEADISSLGNKSIYVNCKIADSLLYNGQTTKALCNYENNSFNLDVKDAGGTNYFKGIAFINDADEKIPAEFFQITEAASGDYPKVINQAPISIKQLGPIIKTGSSSILDNEITVNLTQANDSKELEINLSTDNLRLIDLELSVVGEETPKKYKIVGKNI